LIDADDGRAGTEVPRRRFARPGIRIASAAFVALLLSAGPAAAARAPAVDAVRIRAEPGREVTAWIRVPGDRGAAAVVRGGDPPAEPLTTADLAFHPEAWIHASVAHRGVASDGMVPVLLRIEVPPGTPTGVFAARVGIGSRGADRLVAVLIEVPGTAPVADPPRVDASLSVGWLGPLTPTVASRVGLASTGAAPVGGLLTMRSWPGGGFERRTLELATATERVERVRWSQVPLFGRLTLTVETAEHRGPSNLVPAVAQVSVWVIPWHLLAALPLLVLLLLVLVRMSRRDVTTIGWPARRATPEGRRG
jgi:hypothetical protein